MERTRRRVEEAVRQVLERDAVDRSSPGGLQLYASIRGEVVADMAVGSASEASSMTPGHVFNLTCALKPVLALAVLLEAQEGRLALDDTIDAWLPETGARRGSFAIRHLLTHTSGLADPDHDVIRRGEEAVCGAALSARYPPGWIPGERTHYTAVIDWQLLGMILEAATREKVAAQTRRLLQVRLQMQDTQLVLPERLDGKDGQATPLGIHHVPPFGWCRSVLVDQIPAGQCVPASTGIGTMRDLGRFYETAVGFLPCDAQVRSAFDTMRGVAASKRFRLPAAPSYGLGFAIDLGLHYISPNLGVESFGHGARGGAILGMADPTSGLVIAVLFNSALNPGHSVLRRRAVIDGVMHATGVLRGRRRLTQALRR